MIVMIVLMVMVMLMIVNLLICSHRLSLLQFTLETLFDLRVFTVGFDLLNL